ncbi:PAS domain S-box protein [Leeia sp. TBRC 13508]|uniref:histidine kinase n=1 Tax=Leeia speluncae TaxID=2884804 RepID=A0ABS8D1X7_9NEIS|nr:PAS domain S-box protein [Leeia speluncae]MCB6182195.1 PAS domain S-box protein [Leeia speluncae]
MRELTQQEDGFLASLIDLFPIGIAVLDRDLRLVYINQRQANINKLPLNQQIGHLIEEFIPLLAPVIRPLLSQVVETGVPIVDQEVIGQTDATGYQPHRIVSYYPWQDETGVRGVIAFVRDSETDPLVEHVLRAGEQRLLNVLNNLAIFVGVMSIDGTLLDVNRAPLQSAGVDASEVCGRKLWDCYWWQHDPLLVKRIESHCNEVAKGRSFRFDVEVRKKSGQLVWIDFMLAPLINSDGVITHIIPSAIDIDQRHRSELALKESEERYRSLVDSSDDAIISKSLQSLITSWNPAAERLFGYAAEEVIGKHITCLFPPDKVDEEKDIMARLVSGERVRHYETERIHKNGTKLYLSVTVSPIFNANGAVVGACKIARDISLEKAHREAREAALAEKTALLHEVHHRVKNNLQIVSSLLNLQARKSPPHIKSALAESQGRIKAMALVHQLLYEANNMAEIDLNDYLRRLVSLMSGTYSASENGIHIRFNASREPVVLELQRTIPCALVVNEMILNAIKHAFINHPKPEIIIDLRCLDNGKTQLDIIDNGIGLPEHFALSSGDTLGIQLIPMFVQQLGGEIQIPKVEKGTCFRIEFEQDGVSS